MPISIDFLANVSNFLRGTRQVDDALDDVSDSLDDLARDGEASTEDLERSFKDLANKAKRAGDDAGDGIGRGVKKGTDDAERSLDRLKDEGAESGKEAAASFSGEWTDGLDFAQEVAAQMGPLGIAGALIIGAAAGLGQATADAWSENTEAMKEAAGEWAESYIAAGGKVLTASITTARGLAIATDAEQFEKATENAKNWGVDVGTAIAAMSGEAWALATAQASLAERSREADAALAEQETQVDASAGAAYDLADSVTAGKKALEEQRTAMELGAQQADAYSQYLSNMAKNTDGATTAVDEFGDSITTLPDGKQIYIDAETGQATTDTDAIEQKIYNIPDKTVTVRVDTTQADSDLTQFIARTRPQVEVDLFYKAGRVIQ